MPTELIHRKRSTALGTRLHFTATIGVHFWSLLTGSGGAVPSGVSSTATAFACPNYSKFRVIPSDYRNAERE
jgi:hypothetical protein